MRKPNRNSEKTTVIKSSAEHSNYVEFMVLLFLAGYLLIDFLPYAERMEIIKPQFLYLNILNIIVGLFIYFNPTLFSNSLLAIFKKSYVFKAYLVFIALAGFSIFAAKNTSLSVNAFAEIIVVFAVFMNFAILLHNRTQLIFKVALLVGISAFLQCFAALVGLKDVIAGSKELGEVLSSTKGNTGNINILSASIMTKIPFLFIGITYFSNWKRWVLIIALFLAACLVFFLNARASLLSMIGITIAYSIFYFKIFSFSRTSAVKATYFILPLLIALVSVNVFFLSTKGDSRFAGTVSRLQQIKVNESSANARLLFWKTAVILIKKNPMLGIGLGNWRIDAIPYEARKNKVVSLNTHNDFLEIAAETGVINGLIYLFIFVTLMIINIKRVLKAQAGHHSLYIILPGLLLIVYGIDALFNFPLYRPTIQLCFCFLMAFTLTGSTNFDTTSVPVKYRKLILTLVLIAILPLYVTYHADLTSKLEYKIKSDNIDFNAVGKVSGDEIVNHKPLLPNVFNTSESFEEYAGVYYLREKKYDQAIKHLDIGNVINPHLGRPDYYKYLMALERGKVDSAHYYVKSSYYTYPTSTTFADAISAAQAGADTTEILNMYRLNLKYDKNVDAWAKTVSVLRKTNYSQTNLNLFLQKGLHDFPGDSTVKKIFNATKITELIIKAQSLFAAGKHQEALKVYHQGLLIDPTNAFIMQNLGFYYFNLGQNRDAIPYFLKALQNQGLFDGKTEYYLGICYLNSNQKENACKYFSLSLARNYPDAKNAMAQFCN